MNLPVNPRIPKFKTVHADLVLLYWQVGARIHRDILNSKRADYGKKIFCAPSRKLVIESGNGFPGNAKLQLGDCAVRPNGALVFPNSTRGNRESSCPPHLQQAPFAPISFTMSRTSIRNNRPMTTLAIFSKQEFVLTPNGPLLPRFTIVAHAASRFQLDTSDSTVPSLVSHVPSTHSTPKKQIPNPSKVKTTLLSPIPRWTVLPIFSTTLPLSKSKTRKTNDE
jgi:hypothetical protein